MKQLIFTAILFLTCFSNNLAQTAEPPCPLFYIPTDQLMKPNLDKTVSLTVETGKEIENYKVTYLWTISDGKILSGQNAKTVTFIRGDEGFEAEVEIQGLPSYCSNRAGTMLALCRHSKVFDEYGQISQSEEKKRIDNFFTELQKDLKTQAVIKLKNEKNLKRRLNFLHSYMEAKGYNTTKIGYLISGDEDPRTQLWEVYAGASMPVCDNTKDCHFVKAEEVKEFIKFISNSRLSRAKSLKY